MSSKESPFPDGCRAALSLTFDGARSSQIDRGLPILDRHRIKGTFFVSLHAFEERLPQWLEAQAAGHELGNHSMTHPCSGNYLFSRKNPLEAMTLEKIEADILEASEAIEQLGGKRPRSFAYPCGQTFVGRGVGVQSYVPVVARHFKAGRGYFDATPNHPATCDFAQLAGVPLDEITPNIAYGLLRRAVNEGGWIIFCGHDVGNGGPQTVLGQALEVLCRYCRDEKNGIWVDTVEAVTARVRKWRADANAAARAQRGE